MRVTTHWAVGVLAGAAVLILAPAAAPAAAERPGFETYVVRRGDTLSAIAGRVFGDAKRWREILRENPQVTNANLIFPGDALLLPAPEPVAAVEAPAEAAGGGEPAATAEETAAALCEDAEVAAEAAAEDGAGVEVPDLPVVAVGPVATIPAGLYRSAGYIADGLPVVAIVAAEDGRELLGSDDAAIVNAPIAPGGTFAVVRVDRRVFHPWTGQYLGWLTRVLGTAEVTCRDLETSTIVLRGMRDAAGVGDYLVTLDPNDRLEENVLPGRTLPECVPPGPADGVIVAFDEDRLAVAEHDLVYLDRGTSSSAAPGSRYLVYRETGRGCRSAVGEVQVLRAREATSTALVTSSLREMLVGDLLRAR
jgi:hypothetical protein